MLGRHQHVQNMSELEWFVAHTRPRREKKLHQFCEQEGFPVTLPCYQSVRKYRGKVVGLDMNKVKAMTEESLTHLFTSVDYHPDIFAELLPKLS